MNEIVIIGAGIAGLTAARALQAAGRQVLVLEKSRGFGGRAATRTVQGNRVDHGAQYFTVRDERLQAQVDSWLAQGQLKEWARGFHTLQADGSIKASSAGHPRYVFPDGMSTMAKLLAEGVEVRRECRVSTIREAQQGWEVVLADGASLAASTLIVNTPAEQALQLCSHIKLGQDVVKPMKAVNMTPCYALMLLYPMEVQPAWRGLFVEDTTVLSWLAVDSSKRDTPEHTVLVAHASPAFSQRLFDDSEAAEADMLAALAVLGAWTQRPLAKSMQRWRYAIAQEPLAQGYLKTADELYFCGDWCQGNRLEGAYLSGLEVAQAVMAQ